MKSTPSLLAEISHCPNVPTCLQTVSTNHPCYEIVCNQGIDHIEYFQVPEPWNGHIETAPLLYLSSNPSISEIEEYPRWNWPEELIEDFFINRFGGGKKEWVKDGNRGLARDGTYLKATAYWSEIINRSRELFGHEVRPGVDYVIKEIVHCKSTNMIGVENAVVECGKRYLKRVLQVSNAKVIAAIGQKVGSLLRLALCCDEKANIIGPRQISGRDRIVLFLVAPGSNKPRMIEKVLSGEEIELIRSVLSRH